MVGEIPKHNGMCLQYEMQTKEARKFDATLCNLMRKRDRQVRRGFKK